MVKSACLCKNGSFILKISNLFQTITSKFEVWLLFPANKDCISRQMSCIIAASGFPHTAYSKYFPPKIHEVFFIRWHWYLALIGIQFGPVKFVIVFTADIFALKQWFDWLALFPFIKKCTLLFSLWQLQSQKFNKTMYSSISTSHGLCRYF